MTRSPSPAAPAVESGDRAAAMAAAARGAASAAGVELPEDLLVFVLAGPGSASAAVDTETWAPTAGGHGVRDAAALALVHSLEASLTQRERRRGAHYTPPPVADRVAALALEGARVDGTRPAPAVGDPACGAGALLLAAGRRLEAAGLDRATIARDLLWGADVDPVAVAVAEAAIAIWAGGTPPRPGHVAVADTLHGAERWGPPGGFDVVVGNPPFQGQLARATARTADEVRRLRQRWRIEASPYVDTAALFLLVGVDIVRPGGRVAMVQPQSTAAARDAGAVRAALATRARLHALWAPADRLFRAGVHVCVPVLERLDEASAPAGRAWSELLADQRGIPVAHLDSPRTIGEVAEVVAGFREEYYALVPHVTEAGGGRDAPTAVDRVSAGAVAAVDAGPVHPLVTSGAIDVGAVRWGQRIVRFAKRTWDRPVVDVPAVRATSARLDGWLDRVLRPKVVVASQTRVVEAAADPMGLLVPVTPAVSVVPRDVADVARLAAVLCSPPVSAWVARRSAGNALSPDALRIAAPLIGQVPLPPDDRTWQHATEALAAGDLGTFAARATAMYGLTGDDAGAVLAWWHARRPAP